MPFASTTELAEGIRTHRAELCSRIGRRIVDIAHCCFDQDNYAAQQLLVEAYRLYWPILFAKRLLWLCLKLLIGPGLFGTIGRLTKKM